MITDVIRIKKNEIKDYFSRTDWLVLELKDHSFDPFVLRDKLLSIKENFSFKSKDGYDTYKAIGLQYSDNASTDEQKLYDSVESILYINEQGEKVINVASYDAYSNSNSLMDYFKPEHQWLTDLGINFYRSRLLQSLPTHYCRVHKDNDFRYHLPITTNSECYIRYHINENTYLYKLDKIGTPYILNAHYFHDFFNQGDTERTHLCAIID